MFCTKCGTEQGNESAYCHNCGNKLVADKENNNPENKDNGKKSKAIIKCGNCSYIGKGESARSAIGWILALLCIFICWPITVIYFFATSKYKCPKCNSTFLGVKNKQGVFTQQKTWGVLGVVLIVLVSIAVIGLLSTLAVVSLNNARLKSRDAKRVSDVKQIQTALELYNNDYEKYPSNLFELSNYLAIPPTNPTPNDGNCASDFEYKYDQLNNGLSYELNYCLGEDTGNIKAGYNTANPDGVNSVNSPNLGKPVLDKTDSSDLYSGYSKAEFINEVAKEAKKSISFPKQIDEITTFADITAQPDAIRYHYILTDADTSKLSNELLKNNLVSSACQNSDVKDLLNKDINMEYSYTVKETADNYLIILNKADCL